MATESGVNMRYIRFILGVAFLWNTYHAVLPASVVILFSSVSAVAAVSPPTNATNLPIGTCRPDVPCTNGACCNGNSGLCGFGKTFCTKVSEGGNCTSNCDALADCGEGSPGGHECPLNVCCSKFGFCGTTSDFCDTGCQSNCGQPSVPSCGVDQNTALKRRIGYYGGWANSRKCSSFSPEQIDAVTLTHVNFAFALVSPSFEVVEMTAGDSDLWRRTTALKKRNPSLEVFLSIGGWTFNDPPTQSRFSDLASSEANRKTFARSCFHVMQTYGFDGIDIDWEYPTAKDRGGKPEDKENYVALMKLLYTNFREMSYGLTFTAPASYWYLQNFDLPGMQDNVDWINLMSYDLHGTWDRTDDWIGPIVAAHTNLTEIDLALDLFWRAGVKPANLVLGLGFYGRSFTLDTASCNSPGCTWGSGGNAGPCSDNVGSLMWSEIKTILNGDNHDVVFDADAAVQMLTFSGNQWVSYDDEKTFEMKLNYANERCLGGTMIWSIDQDDPFDYSALRALYPAIDDVNSGEHQGGGNCFVTGSEALSCGNGFSIVATAQDKDSTSSLVCCPTGDMPRNCKWIGDGLRPCSPACEWDQVLIATSACDVGGSKGLCCDSSTNFFQHCRGLECTDSSNAKSGCTVEFPDLLTTAWKYCPTGKVRPFCCTNDPPPPLKNCQWVGTTPLCYDNICREGQIMPITDPYGDHSTPCSGNKERSYCCDAEGDSYSPVDWQEVFDTTDDLSAESMTFDVEFDPDQNSGVGEYEDANNDDNTDSSSSGTDDSADSLSSGDDGTTDNSSTGDDSIDSGNRDGAGTSSDEKEDEDEDDEAFGEIFIDSPNPNAVSSLDLKSNWVIAACDARSDKPQVVLAYCATSEDPGGCSHVFIGGAENTIVQMPKSCGRGPYARIAKLVPHADQSALDSHVEHHKRKNEKQPLYELHFDYNFAAIPDENGPIYMRADVTDMPGYWNSVVDSPHDRRDWHHERDLEGRWWGSFKNWLNKINAIESDNSVSRAFHWRDKWNIFHKESSCSGPPAYEAIFDVTLRGKAQFNSRYGFYLQGTVVPPNVKSAYLYIHADSSAKATVTIEGTAKVSYDSEIVQFAKFGFPGLYYPGLLTIGPSLAINGYISGELSLQGTLTTDVEYRFPSLHYALGKGSDDVGSLIQPLPGGKGVGFDSKFGYNVDLAGDLAVHVVPQIQFGVQILGGKLLDAEAFVRADIFAGVGINGSVSSKVAPNICFDLYYGAEIDGGLTGNVLYWEAGPLVFPFFKERLSLYSTCYPSVDQPATIHGRDDYSFQLAAGNVTGIDGEMGNIAVSEPSAWLEHRSATSDRVILPREFSVFKRAIAGVPPVPGNCACAAIDDQINTQGEGTQCDVYAELDSMTYWDSFNRRTFDDFGEVDLAPKSNTSVQLRSSFLRGMSKRDTKLVQEKVCGHQMQALTFANAQKGIYFDFANPTTSDASVTSRTTKAPNSDTNSYGREHIYELQTVADFISEMHDVNSDLRNLWVQPGSTGSTLDFCTWVFDNIFNQPVVKELPDCLPYNSDKKYMPWLNGLMNGIKGAGFHSAKVDKTTFRQYTWSARVARLRSTAAVLSYMNTAAVRQEFISESDCIKGVWRRWLAQYLAQSGTPATAANVNIENEYSNFIKDVVGEFHATIVESISDMQDWWEELAPAPVAPVTSKRDMLVNVLLDYNQRTCAANANANTQISLNQLMSGGITPVLNAYNLNALTGSL